MLQVITSELLAVTPFVTLQCLYTLICDSIADACLAYLMFALRGDFFLNSYCLFPLSQASQRHFSRVGEVFLTYRYRIGDRF